jgi:hypothetical protein
MALPFPRTEELNVARDRLFGRLTCHIAKQFRHTPHQSIVLNCEANPAMYLKMVFKPINDYMHKYKRLDRYKNWKLQIKSFFSTMLQMVLTTICENTHDSVLVLAFGRVYQVELGDDLLNLGPIQHPIEKTARDRSFLHPVSVACKM